MAGKKTGASVSRLCLLHELLVDMFIKDIQDAIEGDYPLASADKNVIVTFLKNENITATPDAAIPSASGVAVIFSFFKNVTITFLSADGMEKLKEELKDLSEAQRAKVDALVTQVESGQFDDLLGPIQ
ncbi:terminase small subunit [Acinetobacter phage vB_AbaP_B5]|uniref:DNA maturase A n=1 Tax=Acinetobacter phage vB_AbaP_B5 TaxID=2678937 RepID=A0A221SBU5_9CAUD|nr:terminase small subunit [Acinetobacter phage vB_AbaP_B5]ASN73458.1 DNA maturase A [Acinetobacter phage vB_AbaP_B5]